MIRPIAARAQITQGTDPGPLPAQPAVVPTPNGGAHVTLAPPSGRA